MKFREKTILQTIAVISILLAASSSTITTLFSKLSPSLAIIVPAGIFVLFYKVVVFIYKNLLWNKIHKKENLSGLWLFFTTDSNNKIKAYGTFKIEHSSEILQLIEGKSWFIKDEPLDHLLRSVLSSRSVTYSNNEFNLFYDTKNIKEGSFMGAIKFLCSGSPPNVLNGVYTSLTNPKKVNGEIHAKKYDKALQSSDNLKEIIYGIFNLEGGF